MPNVERMVARTLPGTAEEQLRLFVEHVPAAVAMFDREMRYLAASRQWAADHGVPELDLTGRSHYAMFPDLPERWRQAHRRGLAGEVVACTEDRWDRADGSVQWLRWEVRPWPAGDGSVGGIVISIDDSTARKRIEEQLRRNHDTFFHLIQNNPFGIYVVDADFRLRQVSLGAQKVFESVRPLLGRDFDEVLRVLWPEPFVSDALAQFRHTLATGEPYVSLRTVERRADVDEMEAYDWRIERVVLPDGRYGVVCYFYDLSERLRWEAALLERERALQTLADNIPDVISRFDRKLRNVFVNSTVSTALGLPPEEVVGKTNRELGLPMTLCDRWDAAILAAFEHQRTTTIEFPFDGPWGRRVYAARMVPERGPDGTVEHVLAVTHDVTDAKRAEGALLDADRRKDEFLATLAHELRNPLAPVLSAVELLRQGRDAAADETTAKALGVIDRQLGHLVRLVDDLLDVARIGRGMLELARERLQLRDVLEHAVEAARPRLEEMRHALVVEIPETPMWVHGDRTRLAQVVGNLLHNAAKYTERGGHVALSAGVAGAQAIVRVADDGIGIPPDALPRVFDLFAQVDEAQPRAQGGLGIGLALVRRLVELHGGTIEAQSPGPGRGSTFTVRLPLAPAP